MIGDAPRSYITGVPGWETPAEQEMLVRLAQTVPENGVIFNIGAEYGMSDSLFSHGAHTNVELFSVDTMDDWTPWLTNLAEAGFASGGFDGRVAAIKTDSSQLGKEWHRHGLTIQLPDAIDLLFIDGDHSYRGCKADIEAWTPHVNIGGRVAFHDVACETNKNPHPLHYEVLQAIVEWRNQVGEAWALIDMVDSIMVFERRS